MPAGEAGADAPDVDVTAEADDVPAVRSIARVYVAHPGRAIGGVREARRRPLAPPRHWP